MVGRQHNDAAELDCLAAGLLEWDRMAKEPAERRGAERDGDLRSDGLDLRQEVWATRGDLIGLRSSVRRRAALDDVRDVGFLSRKADGLQSLVEDLARRSNEWTSGCVLVAARCLADYEHGGIDGPLSGNRMDASRVEAAPGTAPHGRGDFFENFSSLLRPNHGA
jgi:hypothetical protein